MEPSEIRNQTLNILRTCRNTMMSFQYMSELESKPKNVKTDAALALSNVQLAILKLENEELEDIIDKLKENEQSLVDGRRKLKLALGKVTEIENLLKATNELLQTAAKFVPLFL